MVNLATYIGYDQAGFWGSLTATVGVVLPAYLVILLIVRILRGTIKNRYVQAVLGGLKPCVTGIVLAMGVYLVVHNVLPGDAAGAFDLRGGILTAALAGILALYPKLTGRKLSPIALICISAVLGVFAYAVP
jgi:chromate transporter